jgi:Txe/YoeB family toxin of Txe-Axe toxin-antitoxin module
MEHLKQKVEEYTDKKWEHYLKFQEYDEKLKKAKEELIDSCDNHDWVIDNANTDPCRTNYYCSKCNHFR